MHGSHHASFRDYSHSTLGLRAGADRLGKTMEFEKDEHAKETTTLDIRKSAQATDAERMRHEAKQWFHRILTAPDPTPSQRVAQCCVDFQRGRFDFTHLGQEIGQMSPKALGNIRCYMGEYVRELLLPPDLWEIPPWLACFPNLRRIIVPHFKGGWASFEGLKPPLCVELSGLDSSGVALPKGVKFMPLPASAHPRSAEPPQARNENDKHAQKRTRPATHFEEARQGEPRASQPPAGLAADELIRRCVDEGATELDLRGRPPSRTPIPWARLRHLEILRLDGLSLSHAGVSPKELPAEMRELRQLKELMVCDSELRYLPSWLGQLSKLQMLDLSGNRLSFAGLRDEPNLGLVGLGELESARLARNKLVALRVKDCPKLKKLDVSGNYLAPETLNHLRQICALKDEGNRRPRFTTRREPVAPATPFHFPGNPPAGIPTRAYKLGVEVETTHVDSPRQRGDSPIGSGGMSPNHVSTTYRVTVTEDKPDQTGQSMTRVKKNFFSAALRAGVPTSRQPKAMAYFGKHGELLWEPHSPSEETRLGAENPAALVTAEGGVYLRVGQTARFVGGVPPRGRGVANPGPVQPAQKEASKRPEPPEAKNLLAPPRMQLEDTAGKKPERPDPWISPRKLESGMRFLKAESRNKDSDIFLVLSKRVTQDRNGHPSGLQFEVQNQRTKDIIWIENPDANYRVKVLPDEFQ